MNNRGVRIKRYDDTSEETNYGAAPSITVGALVDKMPAFARERFFSDRDAKKFARVFEDAVLMETVDCFIKNDLNVSVAARALYMHRNTLLYRLKAIKRVTGLDLRHYDAAVTFQILYEFYRTR